MDVAAARITHRLTGSKQYPTVSSCNLPTSILQTPQIKIKTNLHSPPSSPLKKRQKKRQKGPGPDLSLAEKSALLESISTIHPVPKVLHNADIKQGKNESPTPPSAATLYKQSNLKQDVKQGGCTEASFENAAFFMVRDGLLDEDSLSIMSQLNPYYGAMVRMIPILKGVDFSDLQGPRTGYALQKEIDFNRVIKLTALAVHYGLDFGRVVRYLGHEYTAVHRDVARLRAAVGPYVDQADMDQMVRILTSGCPAEFQQELPREHKLRMIRRGNQPSVLQNDAEVRSTMNKEEKHSHIVPFLSFICYFAHTAQHVPQGMVIAMGKDPRIVWDGSTKLEPDDIVPNDVTPTEHEPPVTFGKSNHLFQQYLYNTRVSYPDQEIHLASADVKAAFRYPRMQPDLAGMFGFVISGMYYFIATAMVFGSIVSSTSWEPFRRAIEVMTGIYSMRTDLVKKHEHYLDMITIASPPPSDTTFVQAVACSQNPGVLDEDGNQKPIANYIYVDDCLLACMWAFTRNMLAGCIEAIFVVLGDPDTTRRQCSLAINKWEGMHVCHRIVAIGLVFDSRLMSVGVTREYLDALLALLQEKWGPDQNTFRLNDLVTLAGKIGRTAEGAPWVYHLMPHIYASIAYVLRQNTYFLMNENAAFRHLIQRITRLGLCTKAEQDAEHINFFVKKAAKRKFKSTLNFPFVATLRQELAILTDWLHPDSGIVWQCPIAHNIPRDPWGEAAGDACLHGGGGFSFKLRFWWHQIWPSSIYRRTKVFIFDNKDGRLITINALEFVAAILNYAAALTVFLEDGCSDPHPVLRNRTDSTSAESWMNRFCKGSLAGRALGRLFCMLLVNSPLGVNAVWIKGKENEVADDISRIRQSDTSLRFNYSHLKRKYPQLKACRHFQPNPKLLSLLWQCVLRQQSPTHEQIQTLRLEGLGKLIT